MNTLIPIFLGLMLIECVYSWWRSAGWYRLPDTIANVSTAAVMTLTIDYFEPSVDIYRWIERHLSTGWLGEPDGITLAIAFVALDFIVYWIHRFAHRFCFLWAIHEVHHQSERMNYSVALRQSSFLFVNSWLFLLPYAVLGFSTEVLTQVHLASLLYQFITHTEGFSRIRWLDAVFVMPVHHRVHHASNDGYIDKNFGSVLIVWDRLFGTFVEERRDIAIRYGVLRQLDTWSPLAANLIGLCDWGVTLWWRVAPRLVRRARFAETPADSRGAASARGPDASRLSTSYGTVQFFGSMTLLLEFMFRLTASYVVNAEVELAILVVSFLFVPGIFDSGRAWRSIECLRLILLIVAGTASLFAGSGVPALSGTVIAWAVLSLAGLGATSFVIKERT